MLREYELVAFISWGRYVLAGRVSSHKWPSVVPCRHVRHTAEPAQVADFADRQCQMRALLSGTPSQQSPCRARDNLTGPPSECVHVDRRGRCSPVK